MLLVGLTGGIGSGKSTVSAALAEIGYPVIDADAITHELQEPGQPVLDAMIDAFGIGILGPDGRLDRSEFAASVFPNPDALAKLNAIVHPAVGREIASRLQHFETTKEIVVLDVPLLVESGRDDLVAIMVVDVDPEVAVRRLIDQRGFSETDARARMAMQSDRGRRLAAADWVIDNNGDREHLSRQIDQTHRWLQQLRA